VSVSHDPSGGVKDAEIWQPLRDGLPGLPQNIAMQRDHGAEIERKLVLRCL
jgi:hypothetical protein